MKGPFFRLRDILYLPPRAASTAATNNERIRLLWQTRTTFGLTPRRHRMTAARAFAFAAAEREVNGVHGDAARMRTLAFPTIATRFADRS